MKKIKIIAVLCFAIFTACSSAATNTNVASQSISDSTISSKGETGGGGGGKSGSGIVIEEELIAQKVSLEQSEQTQTAPIVIERKIIRNADLTLEASAPEAAQNKITAIAESKSGFVIESSQSGSDAQATTRDTVTMTIRVPSAKFNETLNEIRKISSRVIVENVKGQDVTEEFIDIEAQIKTKKALEEQFLEIMKQSKSVEDALNVQRELADVRGEIEKVEGRKRFLENQASLSTIKIRLQTPTAFSANSEGFAYQLKDSFGRGFDAALSFVFVLVTALIALLPFLIFIALPTYLILRYILKRSRKQKLAREIAREEIRHE